MNTEVMFTVAWPNGKPTLSEAAQMLNVREGDLDPSFGVVLIDPATNEYTVLCRSPACNSARGGDEAVKGPYSNPGIGTFGPPR